MSREEDGEEGRLVALIDMDCFYVQVTATNQNALFGSRDWLLANQGPVLGVPGTHLRVDTLLQSGDLLLITFLRMN